MEEVKLGDQVRPWDFKLAGDSSLTESAGGRRVLQPIFQTLRLQRLGIEIFAALILIVALFCNGANWTSRDALTTFFISKHKTIFFMLAVPFLARC